ncbi:MAG: UdgX family uracil-DNA binding protein, partial [Verrucomicrobiota bacterium]
ELLATGFLPDAILWEDGSDGALSLFDDEVAAEPGPTTTGSLRIPREFFGLAELVACYRSPQRWGVLYRVAWRLTHGGERHLLKMGTDDDLKRLGDWASAVRRDRHKMKAFVRFRKVGEFECEGVTREQFVAWFEPEHDIVELTAPFFAKRFAGMDWSILTPRRCAHWKDGALQFTAGVAKNEAPDEDALEDYWRSYYAHIFNPARLKLNAMQAEMPKKYWRNLPEAPLIAELTSAASTRALRMIDAPDSNKAHVSSRLPTGAPRPEPIVEEVVPDEVFRRAGELSLPEIRELGEGCQACPLHERATRIVFGEGPGDAEIMIVGEQPGDAEDLAGRPFFGPAGRLLDRALSEVGIDRRQVYVTNAVKHFKWKRSGKRRLHQTPSANEFHVCRPWVLAEFFKIKPRILICLGATAARALIRPDFSVLNERGRVADCDLTERVVATVHPSYLLRLPEGRDRESEMGRWIDDLKLGVS